MRAIVDFNEIPQSNRHEIQIQPIVDQVQQATAKEGEQTELRKGNVMARSRMIVLYDLAKAHDLLVCGTENKAKNTWVTLLALATKPAILEPIQHLFKTQVRQVATDLGIPNQILTKAPSAGLWLDQTDEAEFGFSYEDADQV